MLAELLPLWPDDSSDPIRTIVQQAPFIRDALSGLNQHAHDNLKQGVTHPLVGTEVAGALSALEGRLAGAQAAFPLTKDWVSEWNTNAQNLIKQLLAQPKTAPPVAPALWVQPTQQTLPVTPTAPTPRRVVLLKLRVDPQDPDAVSSFLAQARQMLSEQGAEALTIVLTREEDAE